MRKIFVLVMINFWALDHAYSAEAGALDGGASEILECAAYAFLAEDFDVSQTLFNKGADRLNSHLRVILDKNLPTNHPRYKDKMFYTMTYERTTPDFILGYNWHWAISSARDKIIQNLGETAPNEKEFKEQATLEFRSLSCSSN